MVRNGDGVAPSMIQKADLENWSREPRATLRGKCKWENAQPSVPGFRVLPATAACHHLAKI